MRNIAWMVLLGSLVLPVIGCGPHPGNWDEATIEAKLKEDLNLQSIDLQPMASGFMGTGETAEGETFDIEAIQTESEKQLEVSAQSDRGTIEERSYRYE